MGPTGITSGGESIRLAPPGRGVFVLGGGAGGRRRRWWSRLRGGGVGQEGNQTVPGIDVVHTLLHCIGICNTRRWGVKIGSLFWG